MSEFLERISSAKTRALYRYWSAKRRSRPMPSRADIDPSEIKELLPYLLLTDVHHDPLRVQFRLVGTAVVDAAGRDMTGEWLHEADVTGGGEIWLGHYERLVRERVPVCGCTRASLRGGDERSFEWILLPLSSDGETVDKTIELEDWEALRDMSSEMIARATWTVEVFK